MFVWSLVNLLQMLISASTLYFAYTFLEGKDAPFQSKALVLGLLAVYVVFIPTSYNIPEFTLANCEAAQGPLIDYYHILEAFFSLWLLVYLVRKIWKAPKGEERKRTVYLSLGVVFFLLSFSGTNIVSSLTTEWTILQYGLFGMVVFMGFLAYLIVKFRAFNIKLLGAQALVVTLMILTGSQFFFVQSATSRILAGITLLLAVGFGWLLVRSVLAEVRQKEALAVANDEISKRKEELQKMSDKLAQANDQLRKLDNAKSKFISIASHQLRTPPTAVKGFASLLLEGSYGPLTPKQEDAINKIYRANDQQIHFVEDLLSVSRIESGRMGYTFDKWKIEDLCQSAVDNLVFKAKDKGLYIDYKKPERPLPELTIDGPKVREVISNLVDNAVKYTLKGGVTVRIELVPASASRIPNIASDAVRVTVSDTGIGIPATELPYLFAKFSRGKDISRLNTGGTGLGLYVGKSMIEANGGKVWAESGGADKGSRFIVELPVEQSKEIIDRYGQS